MAELGIKTVGELAATPLPRLEAAFGDKDAAWLAALARGVTGALAARGGGAGHTACRGCSPPRPAACLRLPPPHTDDAVEERRLPKSVGCSKTFRGRQALRDLASVHRWLLELGGELSERLEADREDNNRVATLLMLSISTSIPWEKTHDGTFQTPTGAAQRGGCNA